jgi:hypothetical protein
VMSGTLCARGYTHHVAQAKLPLSAENRQMCRIVSS